jgi:hypothetical protein
VDARLVNAASGARRVGQGVSSEPPPPARAVVVARRSVAVAVVAPTVAGDVAAVDGAGRSLMQTLKTWPCAILAAILWSTVAQAAPARAPEPQRNFASAEEAVSALVAALRDGKQADLHAILGPKGDRVIGSGDR